MRTGLRTLGSRNAVVAILFNIAYSYSTSMKNAYRPLVVNLSCQLPVSYVSMLASLFSFVALMCNSPIGALIDSKRDRIKHVLVIVNILRGAIYIFGYGLINTEAEAIILYILDGVVFAFCNIMGPALMAISVDKRAMGSAFALYSGLTQICISSSRSMGASIFNNYGQFAAGLSSGTIAVISGIVLLFLDKNKLCDTMKAEGQSLPEPGDTVRPGKIHNHIKKIFAGVCIAAIPLALCIGLAQIEDQVNNSYLALMAMERGFEYYNAQTLLAAFSGVITIFVGTVCDIINPIMLVYVGLAGKIIGNFLIASTMNQEVFLTGFIMITVTDFFLTVVRVSAIKLFPYKDQGRLSATISMVMSICMMVGTLPAGFAAQASADVGGAYFYSSLTSFLAAIMYTYAIIHLKRRNRKRPISNA